MSTFTTKRIRQALIQIAERNRYPHYSAVVQRAVIEAFRTGQPHHLKAAVMNEPVSIEAAYSQYEIRINEAKQITRGYGMTNVLAVAANMDVMHLHKILCGHVELSESDWLKIENGIKAIERKPDYYRQYRKAIYRNTAFCNNQQPLSSNKHNVQMNSVFN